MMQKLLSTRVLRFIIMLLFLISATFSVAQEKALSQLIKDSNIIIIGSVEDIKCEWEGDNIWTYVSIKCNQTLKGKNENEITIRSLGGKVEEIRQIVSEAPTFEIGEILLVFLKKDKHTEGIYYCIGGEYGKYKYKEGKWIQNNSEQTEDFINKIKNIIKTR